jgi:hypothetical protein
MNQMIIKVAVFLFFIMFIYSGFGKITSFKKKTLGLSKKTGFPYPINELGMIVSGLTKHRLERVFAPTRTLACIN